MADSAKDDLMPHFVYCYGGLGVDVEQTKILIRTKIRKYGIPSAFLTVLHMLRQNLVTKERAIAVSEGKLNWKTVSDGIFFSEHFRYNRWWQVQKSINDDLESYFQNFRNQEKK